MSLLAPMGRSASNARPAGSRLADGLLARLAVATLALVLAGCGGGGDVAGVGGGGSGGSGDTAGIGSGGSGGSGGTTPAPDPNNRPIMVAMKSVAIGPLESDKAITVEGVTYTTHATRFVNANNESFASVQLGRGMFVEVSGTVAADRASGVAHTVRISTPIRGPVSIVERSRKVLWVMGREIYWDDQTAWSGDTVESLRSGAIVEVWGLLDAKSDSLRATRIATVLPTPADMVIDNEGRSQYVGKVNVRGTVTFVDDEKKVAVVGTTPVNLNSVATTGSGLVVGKVVAIDGSRRARIDQVSARAVQSGPTVDLASVEVAWVRGVVTAVPSGSRTVTIDTHTIDVSGARFAGGTADSLVLGREVSVRVRVQRGIPMADVIEFKGTINAPAWDRNYPTPNPSTPMVTILPIDSNGSPGSVPSISCYADRTWSRVEGGWRFWFWACPGWRAVVPLRVADTLAGTTIVYESQTIPGLRISMPPVRMSPGDRAW